MDEIDEIFNDTIPRREKVGEGFSKAVDPQSVADKPLFPSSATLNLGNESIMIKLDINRYPNGLKYINARAWFTDKKMQPKKKKKSKKKVEMAKIEHVEEY